MLGLVDYSTISEYSEAVTKRKGDVRALTAALLLGQPMPEAPASSSCAVVPPAGPRLGGRPVSTSLAAGSGGSGSSGAVAKKSKGKKRGAAALTEPDDTHAQPSARGVTVPKQAVRPSTGPSMAPEILLVDEVDIFFGEDFYGQTHNQVLPLDVPEAAAMLRAVWRLRASHPGYAGLVRAAKSTPEYRALVARFAEWSAIIERELEAMCADAPCFDDPKPHYDSGLDRLGYKVMDGIDYESAIYRYRTAFAHLHAADNNVFRDPAAALKRALKLQVPCGKFSYANIKPECILGVSGTLEALSEYELKVMQRYGIQLYASMPSVYGETQLKFDKFGDSMHIEASLDGYQRKITDEVNHKVREGRAVIVFFEAGQLDAYTSSAYFKKVGGANVLHERLDPKARDFIIRKAATHGQATFASESFGRGTDFFCKDSKLTNAGAPPAATGAWPARMA